MLTLKHVVVFFILQNTVSSECFVEEICNDQYNPDSFTPITSNESIDSEGDGENNSNKDPDNSITQTPEYSSTVTPEYSSTETPEYSSTETPDNSSTETPDSSTTESSEDSSTEAPDNNSTEAPDSSTTESSEDSSTVTPDNSSTETADNSTTETPEDSSTETPKNNLTDSCPKGHSIISHNDINYLIDENAEILKIKQQLENSSYPDAEELIQKFKGELEIFLKKFIDRPDHMQDILNDTAALRQRIEPDVRKIVAELELVHTFEDDMNRVVASSDNKIKQLERFKNLCQINCEDIRNRFGQNNDNNPLVLLSAGMYCIKLEDLNNIINGKIREVQAQHNASLYVQREVSEKIYAQKFSEFKTNLKKSAVKLFGMTMYDILSLQDDYHHFVRHLMQANISSETHNIRKNTAEISLRLIGLESALEKYRQHCVNCFINQRIKYNVIDLLGGSTLNEQKRSVIQVDNIAEIETIVIELIKVKIDAIREDIKINLNAMFEELDRKLNDSVVIDEYLMQLRPLKAKFENDVKAEHDAFLDLKRRIPEASVDNILELSKKSKETIQTLESAKQFIDQFIS